MPITQLRFEKIRVRGQHSRHSEKYTFLGYADGTLVIQGVLPDGNDLRMRISSMELKVVNGSFRFDFKSEKGSSGEWYPIVRPDSGSTRAALTQALKTAYAEHLGVQQEALTG